MKRVLNLGARLASFACGMGEIRVQSPKPGAAIGKVVFGTMVGLSGCNIHFIASGKEFGKKSVLASSNVHANIMDISMFVQKPLLDGGEEIPSRLLSAECGVW